MQGGAVGLGRRARAAAHLGQVLRRGARAAVRALPLPWPPPKSPTHPPTSYVIDAAAPDRLEDSRAALEKALSARELDGAPLLLLAAKADLAGAGVASEVVRSALGSLARGCEGGERERAVRLVETCSLTGAGLREGLAWVLEAARRARRTRLLDAAAER